jgi:hypothetical protein
LTKITLWLYYSHNRLDPLVGLRRKEHGKTAGLLKTVQKAFYFGRF